MKALLLTAGVALGSMSTGAGAVQVLDWDDLVPEGVEIVEAPVLHGWFEFDESDSLEGLADRLDDGDVPFGDDPFTDDPFADDLFGGGLLGGLAGLTGFLYPPSASKVVAELDGRVVRLPGFIVPLDIDDVGNITEFFLVPYYGACIHVPPPPPNQLVHVTPDEAFPLQSMWDPFWIEGTIRTEQKGNALGLAGYTMTASSIEVYEY